MATSRRMKNSVSKAMTGHPRTWRDEPRRQARESAKAAREARERTREASQVREWWESLGRLGRLWARLRARWTRKNDSRLVKARELGLVR
jgi:hypothetical protein